MVSTAAWVGYGFGAAAFLLVVADIVRRLRLPRRSFRGKHVLITGGSQGIGKALGKALVARGARVSLLARTEATLSAAADEIRAEHRARLSAGQTAKAGPVTTASDNVVQYVSASITDSAQLTSAIASASESFGPPDVLVCCAGNAAPGLFLEQDVATFRSSMELIYMGTVQTIKAVIKPMVERRDGQIIIVGSAMSVVGFMGYSSYAPAKHALRGLADTLRNELVGFNVAVQIAYPPDTDTPGFENENRTKPIETMKMVPVDVYSAEKVAESMLRGAETGLYHLPSPDPLLNVMISTLAGVSPRAYPFLESWCTRPRELLRLKPGPSYAPGQLKGAACACYDCLAACCPCFLSLRQPSPSTSTCGAEGMRSATQEKPRPSRPTDLNEL